MDFVMGRQWKCVLQLIVFFANLHFFVTLMFIHCRNKCVFSFVSSYRLVHLMTEMCIKFRNAEPTVKGVNQEQIVPLYFI